jgi:hypothetical protein
VTSCTFSVFENALPDHLAAIDAMSDDQVRAHFTEGSQLPRATVRIRLKKKELGDHLKVGLAWDSAASDMG